MPRQDEPVPSGGKKHWQDDMQASLPTDAPDKDPSGAGQGGADISPSAGDPVVTSDPFDESPAEDATDDPDSTSDTILTPGSPSEYDRQRDARPNRDGDNWATDMTGR